MEKIFQILAVFAVLMVAVNWYIRGKEPRFREYVFAGRFTFPLSGDYHRQLLTTTLILPEDNELVPGAADATNRLVFRVNGGRNLLVTDEATGDLLMGIPLDASADAVLFDPATRMVYCGSAEGLVIILRQTGRDTYKVMQQLAVQPGYTALSLDPSNGKLYVHSGVDVFVYAPA